MTSHQRKFRLAAAVSFMLVLGACAGGYELPPPVAASPAQMTPDAQAVAAAVEHTLRGASIDQLKGVRFAPGIRADGVEREFSYGGFDLVGSSLLRYGPREAGGDGRVVGGTLAFRDPLGRRTEVVYYADYRFAAGGVELTEMRIATLFSIFPETRMFVVPVEAVTRSPGGLPKVHTDFLRFVAANAVDWTRPEAIPRGEREYVIFVVVMERVSPGATLEVKISDKPKDTVGYKSASKYLDFNGWRVGFVPGRFALDRAPFYVKAVFAPGDEVGVGARYQRLVGDFPMNPEEARKQATTGATR